MTEFSLLEGGARRGPFAAGSENQSDLTGCVLVGGIYNIRRFPRDGKFDHIIIIRIFRRTGRLHEINKKAKRWLSIMGVETRIDGWVDMTVLCHLTRKEQVRAVTLSCLWWYAGSCLVDQVRSIYLRIGANCFFTRRLWSWSQSMGQSIGVVADLCVTIKWLLRTMTRQKPSFSIRIFDELCWEIVIRLLVLCYWPCPFIRQSITLQLDDSLSRIERSSGRPGAVVPRFDCIPLDLC